MIRRDNGLPYSNWIRRVNTRLHVPVNAIIVTASYTSAAALINIGSSVAFNALISLSTVTLMGTYVMSIGSITLKRLRGEQLPHARWSLGRWSLTINCIGLFYAMYASFWSFWPCYHHVTAVNFNWAPVLFVGLIGLACVLYRYDGVGRYQGPVTKVQTWMSRW